MAQLLRLSVFAASAWAIIPALPGFSLVWSDDFDGPSGSSIDWNNWNQVSAGPNKANSEVQTYTSGTDVAHLSGNSLLYIIPKQIGPENALQWTSARLESQEHFSIWSQAKTTFEWRARFPPMTSTSVDPNSNSSGLWPAIWMMGASIFDGVAWPANGEIDVVELVSGLGSGKNQVTVHGGPENHLIQKSVSFSPNDFHTWSVTIDRTPAEFADETMSFTLDRNPVPFAVLRPSDFPTAAEWEANCHDKQFLIMNVAITNGGYGGAFTQNTMHGFDGALEVDYAAVFRTRT